MKRYQAWWVWLCGGAVLSALLAVLDPRGQALSGLSGYLALGIVVGLVAWYGLRQVAEPDTAPRLAGLISLALILRLGVGVALARALPVHGYDSQVQREGYVFQDAWLRDRDAWDLGRSEGSLFQAFSQTRGSDQYGGLLFVSGAVYRFLSDGVHRPLMVVLLTAAVGSVAAAYVWSFARGLFGDRVGWMAAWLVALYPDYVLLGASQMREPFVVCSVSVALYGFARMRLGAVRAGAWTVLVGASISLLISPPYVLLVLALVGIAWIWERRAAGPKLSWAWGAFAALGVLALLLTLIAWSEVGAATGGGPLAVVLEWMTAGADYQLFLLERGSGWVQKLFALTPEWAHAPMATIYGLTRPLLPAALADNTGATIWRIIGIWRSLGWFLLLPLLIYASLASLRSGNWRGLEVYLMLVVWVAAILVSYRAAGDDWDNPRYRTVFIPLMGTLAAWGWWHAKRVGSLWLRRTLIVFLGGGLIFAHWFFGRYYLTPRLSLELTLAAMVAFWVAYLGGAIWVDRRRRALPATNAGDLPSG